MFLRLLGPPLQWIIMMNAYNIHQINLNVYKRNETSSSYYISFHLNAMSDTEDDWTKQICRDIYYWNITAFVDIGVFIDNFEHIAQYRSDTSIADFEQVNASFEHNYDELFEIGLSMGNHLFPAGTTAESFLDST